MATNDFLPFGNAPGANVASLNDYSSNSGYAQGYQSGVAQSKFLNRTWRQSSMMAAMIGQFMADRGTSAVDDGVVANLALAFTAAITAQINNPVRVVRRQVFTASGTYTPTPGTVFVEVEIVGGGGGSAGALGAASPSASSGGGGGAGSYAKRMYSAAQLGANASFMIGAGGAGGAAGANNGTNGGASVFTPANSGSMVLTCNPGGGGFTGPASTVITTGGFPGAGGVSSGGEVNIPGDNASYSITLGSSSIAIGAPGASSRFGAGGLIGAVAASGNPGTGYGSGASGAAASTTSRAGANGAPGLCVITEYCYQ